MDRRAWWLAWVGAPLLAACVVAAAVPGTGLLGDAAMGLGETAAAVVTWIHGRPRLRRGPGWWLLSAALLLPVLWAFVGPTLAGSSGAAVVSFSWAPTIPAYLLVICASFTFLDRAHLRAGGPRFAVELVLFATACLVATEFLVLGPEGEWGLVRGSLRIVLIAAVLTMSASMGMGLTLVGLVDDRRRRMALALLAGSVLTSAGQGLGASPVLAGDGAAVAAGRLFVVAGMVAFAVAVLADRDGRPGLPVRREAPAAGRAQFRLVAPYVAMFVAALFVVLAVSLGHTPGYTVLGGLLACVGLAGVHRWLSAREESRMAARLQRSESYFRSLVGSSGDAVVILDGDLRISWASTALGRMVGPEAAAALVGRPLLEAVHPDDVASLTAALPRGGDPADPGLLLLRLRDGGGTWRFLEAGLSDLRRDTDVGAVVLHCRDMTDRLAREKALNSAAYTDPMTGLPNRAGWLRALEQAVAGRDGSASLLLIELAGLAEAREHAGREVVTAVVAEIGRRLRATVRGEDLVARLGGGAFAVLAGGSPVDADQLAARCLAVVEQPIPTPAMMLELTASIGVAPLEPALSVEDVRTRAELAVRAARAAGPGSAVRYSADLGAAAARREQLRTGLEGSVTRGELSLAYLPVVSLTDQRVVGIEALLRWRHPELGQIPPAEFLPLAEGAGLIGDIQRWVLREATAAAVALPVTGTPMTVGVNVSAGYLRGGTVVADVQAALDASGLPPERLVLEVTDAALLAAEERIVLDVASLRLMGVHVALDDFGTGDSAIGQLTALPLDVLKIDVTLVARVDKDPQALALCESIVGIGHALGLNVGAEGVETPAQLAALLRIGCSFAQGFLIARPMSLAEVTTLLRDGAGQLWPGLVGQR